MAKKSRAYKVMSSLAVGVATGVAKKALDRGWRFSTGRKPPTDAADPAVSHWEAAAWSAVYGGVVALVKIVAQRRVLDYYAKSTGHLPPQYQAKNR